MNNTPGSGRKITYRYNKLSRNALVSEALESFPGITRVISVRNQAEAMINNIKNDRTQVGEDSADRFFAAGQIDKDWLESLTRQALIEAGTEYKIQQLGVLIDSADTELEEEIIDSVDDILSFLNAKLSEVLAPLSDAATRLEGIDSPTEAIQNGVADAWSVFVDAAEKYEQLLEAQDIVRSVDPEMFVSTQSRNTDDPRANTSRIKNIDDIWPTWSAQPPFNSLIEEFVPYPAPWPTGGAEFLLWAVRDAGVDLWVPTASELAAQAQDRSNWINAEVSRLARLGDDAVRAEIVSGAVHPAVQSRIDGWL
ncbi:hypothetical protein [Nocardia sp. NPDC059239]|uniref:hypothetical protein n=1 Tax=unclassified Nocardia TaxID=2637762 RepID=UPI00369D948E